MNALQAAIIAGRRGRLIATAKVKPKPAAPSAPVRLAPNGRPWLDVLREVNPGQSRIMDIQTEVAADFKFTREDLTSQRRRADIALARHVAIFLAKELTTKSLPFIARQFNIVSHTTVIHAIERIGRMIGADPWFAARVAAIRERVANV